MGMASSQARLLMITSRMHDIEYQAQSIQNAKLQLATQQDEAYEKYQQALDATTLTMQTVNGTSGEHSTIPANFSNVFGLHAANPAGSPAGSTSGNNGYILLDSRGRVVVDDEVANAYETYMDNAGWGDPGFNNAYMFAMYMVEGGTLTQLTIPSGGSNDPDDLPPISQAIDAYVNDPTGAAYGDENLKELWNNAIVILNDIGMYSSNYETSLSWVLKDIQNVHSHNPEPNEEQLSELNELINYFYSNYMTQSFNQLDENDLSSSGTPYDLAEFNYYVRIFNAIQEHGGCIAISDFNGPNGDAATNSEWLTAMIQSGQLSIEMAQIDGQGNFNLNGVSVSSDTNLSFTPTSSIDKAALAKAEAEYEHTLKVIDRKDKKYDLDLSKLDTERNALDKQREGIEKVIKDNVDRTFGIFS